MHPPWMLTRRGSTGTNQHKQNPKIRFNPFQLHTDVRATHPTRIGGGLKARYDKSLTDIARVVDVLLEAEPDGLERIHRLDRKLVTPAVGIVDAGDAAAAVDLDVDAQLTVVPRGKVEFNGRHIYANQSVTGSPRQGNSFPLTLR